MIQKWLNKIFGRKKVISKNIGHGRVVLTPPPAWATAGYSMTVARLQTNNASVESTDTNAKARLVQSINDIWVNFT